MRLFVYLLEGKDWVVKDTFVKLQVGKYKSKTRVLNNTSNPIWNEEFVFRVDHRLHQLHLLLSVYHSPRFFNSPVSSSSTGCDLIARLKIPLSSILTEDNQFLPPTWFSLQPPKTTKSSIHKDYGKILLTVSLHGRDQNATISENAFKDWDSVVEAENPNKPAQSKKQLIKSIASRFEKLFHHKDDESSKTDDYDSSDLSTLPSEYEEYEDRIEQVPPNSSNFEELIESVQKETDMPENLQGGILLDQIYEASPKDLNILLFAPDSQFRKELAEMQGTTDIHEGPWVLKSSCLTRTVTYTNAASKLIKAVKATEEQTYLKADEKEFAVFVSVSTPDVPYGNTFNVEILYKIMPGPGEESAHLVVSWAVNFNQSTMMKGMVEGGARKGLEESFTRFSTLLSQFYKELPSVDNKNNVLANLENEHHSDPELAIEYFWNFTVVSSVIMVLYVTAHILLCGPSKIQGLETYGFDLPDSFGEIVTCAILVLQLERVYHMVLHFIEARLHRGSDHGIKAQGDGWVLTIALIEGTNLASMDPTGSPDPDPYVVFTCNGKTRASSVQLQTIEPQWNEILEFDAAEEPPSVLDVEVFDFDGPFDQSASLGHAEINFLKHTSEELADMWVPLEGKLAKSSQSQLHLRIFLDNNNGVETIRDYLTKMEKEVGKKLNLRSPHRNSTFQKTFGLPPEEFLVSDYSCSLKRKMPLQGRLFLSARIVGFYANLFGHKTKFFFLWEDIEDIQVLPPSLSSFGSPLLLIILRKGRGLDARHGAKLLDSEGRLHFYFHSFVSFNAASRTINALWRTRTLDPDQKVQQEEDTDNKPILQEEATTHLVSEDVKMFKVYTAELPVSTKLLMEMFDGGELEHKVMSKSGCLSYTTTNWELVSPDVSERSISYKFNRHVSIFGGEVTCTQQKSIVNDGGWIVNENMTLHDVPFGDLFRVSFRYEIEKSSLAHNSCKCDVYVGVMWLKSNKFQERVTKNIIAKFTYRLKEILELVEREILLAI